MAVCEDNVVCAKVQDVSEAVRYYEGIGCSIKERSEKGAFLDCSVGNRATFFDFATARDEVWPSGEVQVEGRYEADATLRDYFC